jgi:hypothetical protein
VLAGTGNGNGYGLTVSPILLFANTTLDLGRISEYSPSHEILQPSWSSASLPQGRGRPWPTRRSSRHVRYIVTVEKVTSATTSSTSSATSTPPRSSTGSCPATTPNPVPHPNPSRCFLRSARCLHHIHIDRDLLGWWLCGRRCKDGGLNERPPEKQTDVRLYSVTSHVWFCVLSVHVATTTTTMDLNEPFQILKVCYSPGGRYRASQ